MKYEKYDLPATARRALNFLTSMVDAGEDYLPYWLVNPINRPAFARHCRVDDAELAASWYEAIVSVQDILGTDEGREVREGFQRHLMKSWGPKGLRYHEKYPWTHTMHSSFHEMAYILSALNRWLVCEPGHEEAEKRASELVRGMRSLVLERKTQTFWSGDTPFDKPVYEFPNDVYLLDGGWDHTSVTGRGEESIRNGMMLHSLVKRYQLFGDEVALELAIGLANHLLGISRYFNYKGEFFGHVHSAVWVASGLVLLGRLTDNEVYLQFGRKVYEYVLSLSSSFGWVPEYAQWHPLAEEYCETCCIKDMIECSFELIDAGFPQYWDVVNRFTRNQLDEQQIKDGSFVCEDNSLADTEDTTYHNLSQRVVGGWTGGAEPNSISLMRFRCIAGCCVGTAPQALHLVWNRIVTKDGKQLTVNLPIETTRHNITVEIGYPNEGYLQTTVKEAAHLRIRALPFMGNRISLTVNNRPCPVVYDGDLVDVGDVAAGDVIRLSHDLREEVKQETIREQSLHVTWKGADVVCLEPTGQPIRLYQREYGKPKDYGSIGPKVLAGLQPGHTQQKR